MTCDGCNYVSFWAIFCHFTSLTSKKLEIKKKLKSTLRFIILLGYFLPFYPPPPVLAQFLTAQKIRIFLKNAKTPGDLIILHMCTKTYDQIMYSS